LHQANTLHQSVNRSGGRIVHITRNALMFVALLLSVPAFGQVSISPQSPTVLDTIYVQLPLAAGTGFDPASTTVSMASNKITIAFGSSFFHPVPPSLGALNWPVGPLPAGTYQVEIQQDNVVIGSTQFTVLPRPANGPLWNNTDMWWDPTESGWGASFVQHGSGNIFGTFFIYASDGTATWYVMPGGQWTTALEFHGDVYQTRGPVLDSFDPHGVNASLVGSAIIDFDVNLGRASLFLTIGGKTIQKAIQRQTY
jgi:hypothetical protein